MAVRPSTTPKLTPQTVEVLRFLLGRYPRRAYGLEIVNEIGLKVSTVNLILQRWEEAGFLTCVEGRGRGGLPRLMYRMTADTRRQVAPVLWRLPKINFYPP